MCAFGVGEETQMYLDGRNTDMTWNWVSLRTFTATAFLLCRCHSFWTLLEQTHDVVRGLPRHLKVVSNLPQPIPRRLSDTKLE
jgi:hypothetical protein